MRDKLKVWFDKDKNHYRVYTPDGKEMTMLIKHRVSQWYPDEVPTIEIEAFIEVLNERPTNES